MGIYIKSKEASSNLETVEDSSIAGTDGSFKVGIKQGSEQLIIDYLTNLYADPATAVVRELFANACDASDNSTTIEIEISEDGTGDENNKLYKFSIKDHGKGMTQEELVKNYIQYANSTKTYDFDTVGSFGLGSKSPMALVPSYTVASTKDGVTNTAVVERTSNGIYGKIVDTCAGNDNGTVVTFTGFGPDVVLRMVSFVKGIIFPYSGRNVIFTMDGEQITNVLSDNKVVKLPSVNGMDTWYVGTSGFTGAVNLLSLGTIDYFYDIVVRVGNVPYYAKTPSQFEKKGAILVDVTPGYFSFAPSREELPVGRELEHLLNGVEKLVGKEPTEIAKFYVENGLVDENNVETIMFSSRAIACQEARGIIEHDNFVASQRERFANLNEFLSGKKELFGNGNFACCDISSFKGGKWKTLCNTLNDKELDVNEIVRGWVLDSLKISQAYDSLPMTGSKRFSHYERVLRVNKSVASYVFTGVKETRTGKFKVPSEYRKTLLTERVKEDMRKIRADVWKTVSPVQHSQYVLFVKEGVTLSQEQLNVLSLLSPKYSETITSYVEPVTEQIKYVEKSSKQKEGNASVSIFDRVYDVMVYPSYIDRQCEVQELSAYEVIEKYAGKDYFVVRNDVFSFEFLQTVSVLSSRKIIEIRTGNKKVFEKLNLSGIPALFGENEEILKQLEENIGIDKKYVDCFKINNRDRLAFSIDMMDEKLEQEFILEYKNEILTAIATSSVFCQYDNSNFLERNKKYLSFDFQVPERYIYGSWLTQAVNGWHERDAFTNKVFETVFDMQKYYEENEEWVNETAYLELIDFVNDRYNRSVENLVTIVKELEPEWSQKLFGTQGRVNHVGSDFEQIEPLKNYCFKRIQENTNSKFIKRVNAMKQLANLDCIKEDIKCGKNTIANVLSSYEKTPSNKYAACLKSMIDAEIEDVVKSNPL